MDAITDKRIWHVSNNLMSLTATILFALILSSALLGCSPKIETISIDDVYWSAYRNPESFDTFLDTQTLDSRTSDCFLQKRDIALNNEEAKLLECSAILQDSPPWYECHEEAENFHNQAAIMNDIASAIDGSTWFDETQSYAYLLIIKSVFTDTEWNTFVDTFEELTPPFYCDYEGDDEWFWE